MINIPKEEIIAFIKETGPVIPNDLRKKFDADSLLIGANLSELVSRGILKVTSLKRGSSPYYYLPEHEHLLERLVTYLNEKDQETVNWLRQVKVAEDTTLNMLKRVSLRKTPDFAKQLKARADDGREILFWRYFLFDELTAINYLRTGKLKADELKEEVATPLPVKEIKKEIKEEIKQETLKPKIEEKVVSKKREDEEIISHSTNDVKTKEELSKKLFSATQEIPKAEFDSTKFYEKIINYFKENKISVVTQTEIAKNKEYEFLIKVPSTIGEIVFLARARDKAKLNETDVAPALLAAKGRDVSCLFLTTGEFTKKAKTEVQRLYTGLIVKKF